MTWNYIVLNKLFKIVHYTRIQMGYMFYGIRKDYLAGSLFKWYKWQSLIFDHYDFFSGWRRKEWGGEVSPVL